MTDFHSQLQRVLSPTYTIESEIAGGGMSRVFLATEAELGRRVVIKVLAPDMAAGVNRLRFRREMVLAASLTHPHIVPLLASGEGPDFLWYAMPYVEGRSLREAIEEGGPLGIKAACSIVTDVAEALAHAHERGIVHRDIKPANVLLLGGSALVTDFGVAKALSETADSALTSVGAVMGTPAYMSPEQLAGDPAVDHRVDIYALGLVAYEMLSGKMPFGGKSPQETLVARLSSNPEPLSAIRSDIPAAVSAVIARALSKEMADRPDSAIGFARQLESAVAAHSHKSAEVPAVGPLGKVLLASSLALALLWVTFKSDGRAIRLRSEAVSIDGKEVKSAPAGTDARTNSVQAPETGPQRTTTESSLTVPTETPPSTSLSSPVTRRIRVAVEPLPPSSGIQALDRLQRQARATVLEEITRDTSLERVSQEEVDEVFALDESAGREERLRTIARADMFVTIDVVWRKFGDLLAATDSAPAIRSVRFTDVSRTRLRTFPLRVGPRLEMQFGPPTANMDSLRTSFRDGAARMRRSILAAHPDSAVRILP